MDDVETIKEELRGLTEDILSYLPWGEVTPDTSKEVADYLIANGVTIPVRCRECIHAVEIEKDYIRKLFIDGTKQCELGRADTVFGYSIISNDGFCDSGERKEDG